MKISFLFIFLASQLLNANAIYFTRDFEIFFPRKSHKLSHDTKQTLELIKRLIIEKHLEIESILIEGHTSSRGSKIYNQTLSEKRSNNILKYLKTNNIKMSNIKVHSFGESKLKHNPEKNSLDYADNRRVSIKLLEKLSY